MTTDVGSVTAWFGQLAAGDAPAAGRLWDRYARRMQALAKRRIRGAECRVADEEDVALSAFDYFCRAAAAGEFAGIRGRDQLWGLLFTLVARKSVDLVRHERRRRSPAGGWDPAVRLDGLAGAGLTPDQIVQLDEEYRRLLDRLGDDVLREVAAAKLEGYTSAEIAARLGCTERTIERRLRVIRRVWQDDLGGAG
jgi:DNA-directed RNA polymerase specialized sigma24 family protein